jgi:hypothetical protein
MRRKKRLILFALFSIIITCILNSNLILSKETTTQALKIGFPRPLKVNEINFYQIESKDLNLIDNNLFLRIYNQTYKKSEYIFSINGNTSFVSKEKEGWIARGYFFLPNIIPVGKASLQLRMGQSILYQSEINLLPEIVFHSPLFQQGFPPLSVKAETGMSEIIAQSFPVSKISFANPSKRSFFFFSVKLKDKTGYDKLKIKIYVKQRVLDEIEVDTVKKEYVYCFAKNFLGEIEWLKITFETFSTDGKPVIVKKNIYEFEYLSLLPFNGIPEWINSFLKSSDFIEDKFKCRQE